MGLGCRQRNHRADHMDCMGTGSAGPYQWTSGTDMHSDVGITELQMGQ